MSGTTSSPFVTIPLPPLTFLRRELVDRFASESDDPAVFLGENREAVGNTIDGNLIDGGPAGSMGFCA